MALFVKLRKHIEDNEDVRDVFKSFGCLGTGIENNMLNKQKQSTLNKNTDTY